MMKLKRPNRITLNDWQIQATGNEATATDPTGTEDITVKGHNEQDAIRLVIGKVWRCIEMEAKDDKKINNQTT